MSVLDRLAQDPAKDDQLILVDGQDREMGTATKAQAHLQGMLHRAFSVVLWRDGTDGPEVLLARRAAAKYHSAGLWANSCCSHPRAGEELLAAAYRRVSEELGCTVDHLEEIGSFAYRAEFTNGLTEYEYDHVLLGQYAGAVSPDPNEADTVRWIGLDGLADELVKEPEHFAAWAYMVLTMVMQQIG